MRRRKEKGGEGRRRRRKGGGKSGGRKQRFGDKLMVGRHCARTRCTGMRTHRNASFVFSL